MLMWECVFRDKEYHADVDTNNGPETQNTVLKYKFMPKTRANTSSVLVKLLVDRFLPKA